MTKIIGTYGPQGGYRKPFELALDKDEQFNHRVRAINAIGLSQDPKALAMLAIISNQIENDGLKDWSDFWLGDLQKEFELDESTLSDFIDYVKLDNPDLDDASLEHVLSVLLGGKDITPEYPIDSVQVTSSLPWTVEKEVSVDELPPEIRAKYDEAVGAQPLDDETKSGIATEIGERLKAGQFETVEGVFNSKRDTDEALQMVLNVCRAAQGEGLSALAMQVSLGLLQDSMYFTRRDVSNLEPQDIRLLDSYGFIKDDKE